MQINKELSCGKKTENHLTSYTFSRVPGSVVITTYLNSAQSSLHIQKIIPTKKYKTNRKKVYKKPNFIICLVSTVLKFFQYLYKPLFFVEFSPRDDHNI